MMRQLALSALLAALLSGCSAGSDWYEESEEHNDGKEARIQEYERQGLSRKEAESAWWKQEMTYNTETGNREEFIRE